MAADGCSRFAVAAEMVQEAADSLVDSILLVLVEADTNIALVVVAVDCQEEYCAAH